MSSLRTRTVSFLSALAVAALAGSCSADAGEDPVSAATTPGGDVRLVEPDEPLTDASLAEVTKESSLVVSGTVTDVRSGEHLGSDRTLEYSIITVQVDESLLGEDTPSAVKIAMSSADEGTPFVVAGRPVPDVGQRALWFLDRVDPEFSFDGYVLTWSGGQVRLDGNGKVIDDQGQTVAAREAVSLQTGGAVEAAVARVG